MVPSHFFDQGWLRSDVGGSPSGNRMVPHNLVRRFVPKVATFSIAVPNEIPSTCGCVISLQVVVGRKIDDFSDSLLLSGLSAPFVSSPLMRPG